MHDRVNHNHLEKIRTFIAVNLNPDIIRHLAYLKDNINISESKIKWVEGNNLHITIKFLGYITLEKTELIQLALKEIASQYNPFLITLSSHIGLFPNYKMPRIIWVGIKEGTKELEELYNSIEINMLKKGFPREEKIFSSHVTIGRVKYIGDKTNFIQILKTIKVNSLSQEVCSIDLMESKLTPNGPVYNITAKFPLSKQ